MITYSPFAYEPPFLYLLVICKVPIALLVLALFYLGAIQVCVAPAPRSKLCIQGGDGGTGLRLGGLLPTGLKRQKPKMGQTFSATTHIYGLY